MNEKQKKLADFLSEYHDWKLEAHKIEPSMGSPKMDGMPKGSAHDPNIALDRHAGASNECWKREVIVKNLRDVGDEYIMLADILSWRYLHKFSQHKTLRLLTEKYNWDMSEKTLRTKQELALTQALTIIPVSWLDKWTPRQK